MNHSLAHRPNAQAVLDLYGYSERLQIVAALNEERLRHRAGPALRRAVARLRRTASQGSPATPAPLRARQRAVIAAGSGQDAGAPTAW